MGACVKIGSRLQKMLHLVEIRVQNRLKKGRDIRVHALFFQMVSGIET